MQVLGPVFESLPNLTTIKLGHNKLNNDATKLLCDSLRKNKNKKLSALHLDNNKISDDGIDHIVNFMLEHGGIHILTLYANEIGDKGIAKLVAAFIKAKEKKLTPIPVLDLSYNKIGDAGAVSLAELVEKCDSVRDLYLEHNVIGNNGAIALAKSLISNKSLVSFSIPENKVEQAGATALLNMLRENSTILIADLGGIHIRGDELAKAISRISNDAEIMFPALKFERSHSDIHTPKAASPTASMSKEKSSIGLDDPKSPKSATLQPVKK